MGILRSSKPDVGRLMRRGDLNGLRDALRYGEIFQDDDGREWDLSVPVRVEAAGALSNFEAAAVAADLTAALDDRAPAVRLAAVEAIARLETRVAGVLESLLDAVVTRRPNNEAVAARALDVLVAWRVTGTANLLVERLLAPGAPEPDDMHREALDYLLEADPAGPRARDDVAERLLAGLRGAADDRPDDAGGADERAERMLGWLGESALDKVLEVLDNGAVEPGLVRAAGSLGDGRAAAALVRGLQSSDPEIREAAAYAARELNHTQTVPALLTATQDEEQAVRDAASGALDRMGTAAVIAGLAAVVSARGLLAVRGNEIEAVDEEELLDETEAAAELREGEADAEGEADTQRDPARAATTPAAPTPGAPSPDPAGYGPQPGYGAQGPPGYGAQQPEGPPGYGAQAPPGYAPIGPRRRGGLLDRLFGRDYY